MKKAVAVTDGAQAIIVDGIKRVSSRYKLPDEEREFEAELGRLSRRDGTPIRIWRCPGGEDGLSFDEMLSLALGSSGLLEEMEPLGERE